MTAEPRRPRVPRPGVAVRFLAPALALAAAAPALAGDAEPDEVRVEALPVGRVTRQELPFAFVIDPSTPGAGGTSFEYRFGFGSGISADRPLPVSIAASGASYGVSIAHGIGDRLAPFVSATSSQDATGATSASVTVGATVLLTRPSAPFRLAVAAAGIHEGASGASGGAVRVAASLDQGPLRAATDVSGEKVFASGRDRVDLITTAGVSLRVLREVRIGVEYVGQDLEEAFAAGAEGGARHVLGPSASVDLEGGRYQLAVGAAFGLTAQSPQLLARAALAFNF